MKDPYDRYDKIALTNMQIDCYLLYKEGLTQDQIASRLHITQPAVSRHLKRIAKKVGWFNVQSLSHRGKYDMNRSREVLRQMDKEKKEALLNDNKETS